MSFASQAVAKSALSYRQGVLLVLLAGACWSSMGIGIKLMTQANVWQILFYRSVALAPFLLVIIALRSRGRPLETIRNVGIAGVLGGFGLVFAFAGGIFAIQTTTVANAMFLFAAAPFFAALLGRFLLGESVRMATWIAMVVAGVGIAIMVAEGISLGRAQGNIAALLAAFGFASFAVALRWKKLEDMMPAVFLGGVFSIAVAGVACMWGGYGFAVPARDLLIALALGVFQVGAGLTIFTIGSKSVPAAELALLSMSEVVLAPIWVWIFLGETVGIYTLTGGAIVMAAIAGNAVSGLRRRPPPVM